MSDDFSIDVPIIKRVYPIAAEGLHQAVCSKAVLSDSTFKTDPPGSKVLKLWWQLQETYPDDEGNPRPYIVFSKFYGLRFHPKSALSQLCNDLTGKPPVFEEIESDGKKARRFNYAQFENMDAQILVKHVSVSGNIYANIAGIMTTAEQKKNNCMLLPKLSETQDLAVPPPASDTEKPVSVFTTPYETVLEHIAKASTPEELENVHAILILDSPLPEGERKAIVKAYEKRKRTFEKA